METLTLEQLTHGNYSHALSIRRDDIPEEWVDTAASLMEVTDYGAEHNLIGHTYVAYTDGKPVGLIMIGEALAWDTDPDEMKGKPFYRVMGFVVDRDYRGRGIGTEFFKRLDTWAEEKQVTRLELTVICENEAAKHLYEKRGFVVEGIKRNSVFVDGKYMDEFYMAKLC